MGGEGSRDVLKLSAGEGLLSVSLLGAHGVCEGGMAKLYFWGPADGGGVVGHYVHIILCSDLLGIVAVRRW